MDAPNLLSQQKSFTNEEAEWSRGPVSDHAVIQLASVLDDFIDKEVVDKQDMVVGKLACYWQSRSGQLIFLGIKVKGHESILVVPGRRSQVHESDACVQLGFDAAEIESAPHLDRAAQLDATLERAVYDHFGIDDPEPHDGLQYSVRKS
jgi:hypothetical protein